ncbi:MAG: hypothetical protein Q9167_005155 [Letrouitia subvulpina]
MAPQTRVCVLTSTVRGYSPAHVAAAHSLAECLHARSIQLIYGGGTTGLMGELAKKMVNLSGPDSVLGIIPAAIMSTERPEATVGAAKEPGKKKALTGWVKEAFGLSTSSSNAKKAKEEMTMPSNSSSTKKTEEEMSLLNEEIYGRTKIVPDMYARKRAMMDEVTSGGPGSGFIALTGGFGTMDELMEMVAMREHGALTTGVCLLNVDGFWDGLMFWLESAVQAGFVKEVMTDFMVSKDSAEECVDSLRRNWTKTKECNGKKLETLN